MLSEVKTLALEIPKLDSSLARAKAGAEIADAAWTLDRKWSKTLLKDAYALTYLTEDEQRRIGAEPPGTPPRQPTMLTRARSEVRKRILSVARRDKTFANQLLTDTSARLTKDDRQMSYAQVTLMAMEDGDNEAAASSIHDNMAIDPTALMLVELVNKLALKDRAAADKLVLEFIVKLPNLQLAGGKLGRVRAETVLRFLVFPNSFFPDPANPVPNPGPEVMKAYVRYVIESLTLVAQTEPTTLAAHRSNLLTTWLPLNQYAPEFKDRFMQLEAASRTPGKDASLPTQSYEEVDRELLRKRETEALNSSAPNDQVIDSLISRGEFETARKLIEKLPDGRTKSQFTEKANQREAISLAEKGDVLGAQNLAERLTTVYSIRLVYPAIVRAYAAKKDQAGAGAVVNQAVKQLERVSMLQWETIIPLSLLAEALMPIDALRAAEIVDDVVVRVNRSETNTTDGRTSVDSGLFRVFAAKDEVRARSAAQSFEDRFQRVVALAAVYQWKAKQLDQETKKQKP
ncbi:MAG TPA: hypothetical protein VFM63_14610 [Pyrinomonadaceae bacterium]|nr:hypothetical protein [Pyrinomonadaceae bacterium]